MISHILELKLYYVLCLLKLKGVKWELLKSKVPNVIPFLLGINKVLIRYFWFFPLTTNRLTVYLVRRNFTWFPNVNQTTNSHWAKMLLKTALLLFSSSPGSLVSEQDQCGECSNVTENWPWKVYYCWLLYFIQIIAQPVKWEMLQRDGWILEICFVWSRVSLSFCSYTQVTLY